MQTALRFFVELIEMGLQVGDQRFAVGQTLIGLPQAVDLELDPLEAQRGPEVTGQHDELGIDVWPGKSQRFGAELVELAVAPTLRTLVPEHGPHVIEALAAVVKQRMLQGSAHHAGGVLRPQCQLLTVEAVLEGIHLLLDDVGDLAQTPHEQRSGFNDGRAQIAVAVAAHQSPQGFFQPLPVRGRGRDDVVHAFDGAQFLSHGVVRIRRERRTVFQCSFRRSSGTRSQCPSPAASWPSGHR